MTSLHCDKLVGRRGAGLLLAGYCGNHLLLLLLWRNFPRLLLDNHLHKISAQTRRKVTGWNRQIQKVSVPNGAQ